jgi:hypothetical protein
MNDGTIAIMTMTTKRRRLLKKKILKVEEWGRWDFFF